MDRPRILIDKKRLEEIKLSYANEIFQKKFQWLLSDCEKYLKEPLFNYYTDLGDTEDINNDKFLGAARLILQKITSMSFVYLVTHDGLYAEKAKKELLAMCNWEYWSGPYHRKGAKIYHENEMDFVLETGELCLAAAIGYDWLHDCLTLQEKELIVTTIINKGLRLYLENIEGDESKQYWWYKGSNNWNTVCNAAAACAAMSIYENYEKSGRIVELSKKGIEFFLKHLTEDGGWDEGTGYWAFGMLYLMHFTSSHINTFGNDGGVLSIPGIDKTAEFFMYFTPDGNGAGFSDNSVFNAGMRHGAMYALAGYFNKPEIVSYMDKYRDFHYFDIIYQKYILGEAFTYKKCMFYSSVNWAFVTSDFIDEKKIYLAFKSGDLKASHSHNDLNSFNIKAYGEQLVIDQGSGDYNHEYFKKHNTEVIYNRSTRSHNTILVNSLGQDAYKEGKIVKFEEKDRLVYLVGDASGCYLEKLDVFHRHVIFVDNKFFIIIDDLKAALPSDFTWLLHTFGDVKVIDERVVINQNQVSIDVIPCIKEAYTIEFSEQVLSEGESKGYLERTLKINNKEPAENWIIPVVLVPYEGTSNNSVAVSNFKDRCYRVVADIENKQYTIEVDLDSNEAVLSN